MPAAWPYSGCPAVFEPSCTICGLDSGYQGPGSKTVLPAEARAKVDFRLVPDQSPKDITEKLRGLGYIKSIEDIKNIAIGTDGRGTPVLGVCFGGQLIA